MCSGTSVGVKVHPAEALSHQKRLAPLALSSKTAHCLASKMSPAHAFHGCEIGLLCGLMNNPTAPAAVSGVDF